MKRALSVFTCQYALGVISETKGVECKVGTIVEMVTFGAANPLVHISNINMCQQMEVVLQLNPIVLQCDALSSSAFKLQNTNYKLMISVQST